MFFFIGLILALALLGYIITRVQNRRPPAKRPPSRRITGRDPREVERAGQRPAPRSGGRSGKSTVTRLKTVDDPRLIATAMMVAIAEHDGDMTDDERASIIEQATSYFSVDEQTATHLITESREKIPAHDDLDRKLNALSPAIRVGCTPEEREDVLQMLAAVAEHTPDRTATQIGASIARLRNRLN